MIDNSSNSSFQIDEPPISEQHTHHFLHTSLHQFIYFKPSKDSPKKKKEETKEMDINLYLQNILINTYNSNLLLRSSAEKDLEAFLRTNNSFYSLLSFNSFLSSLSSSSSTSLSESEIKELRISSSIYIKNKSRDFFRYENQEESNEKGIYFMIEEEREKTKELLLDLLLNEKENIIRGMLAETVRNITEYEYPQRFHSLKFFLSLA